MEHDPEEVYLADGVYAKFEGMYVRLRAPREYGDHVVYLDDTVWTALQRFMKEQVPWA